jgi:copper chaperone CopZ
MAKKVYSVLNMDCASCALLIEAELEDAGIKCKCSYAKQTLEIEGEHEVNQVKEAVQKAGYDLATL